MTDWQTRALCAGDGRFTSTDPLDLAEAVVICGSCPLTGPDGPCHAWAKTEDFEGVAAGRVWRGKQTTGSPANRASKYPPRRTPIASAAPSTDRRSRDAHRDE
jgi:hypothetical protein